MHAIGWLSWTAGSHVDHVAGARGPSGAILRKVFATDATDDPMAQDRHRTSFIVDAAAALCIIANVLAYDFAN